MALLEYEIIDCSSYSSAYHPNNIKSCHHDGIVIDQGSRWSSNSNNQQQYMILKLKQHAKLSSILFGKFHKVHVCNLKEFKLFISYNNKQYIPVLHDGLKNDTDPESFSIQSNVKSTTNSELSLITYPVQYIKICPLLAHGANFNFSIWYLELHGDLISPSVVNQYIQYHTELTLKVMLKYLRQNNDFLPIYAQLQQHTNISLEHPYLQSLYTFITNGQFDASYTHLLQADLKWFDPWLSNSLYSPKWLQLSNIDTNGNELPCRGGHQMVHGRDGLYLYAGWNGQSDLGDLWLWRGSSWTLLSPTPTNESLAPGTVPSPRSCHKMVYNPNDNCLYIFGKYVDQESRSTANLNADFYKFNLNTNTWVALSMDTQSEGGPQLLFDHQMVIDTKRNQLYVFGGKCVVMSAETTYSGMFKYDVLTNKWQSVSTTISPRISHSMLIHKDKDVMFIFSGQRFKDYLSDMYVFHLDTGITTELSKDYSKLGGPICGFTQRATINEDRNEIYVFSGLVRDKFSAQDSVRNTFWVYHLEENKWQMVFQNGGETTGEPVARYAHQLAFDSVTRTHYLFGGNPGAAGNPKERLNDLWGLQLNRPTAEELLKKIRLSLKTQEYETNINVDLKRLVGMIPLVR